MDYNKKNKDNDNLDMLKLHTVQPLQKITLLKDHIYVESHVFQAILV
jgi:hypothetical protein